MEVLQIVQNISDFSGIPTKLELKNDTVRYIPGLPYQARITGAMPEELFSGTRSAMVVLTDELLCYGCITLDDAI